MGSVDHAERIKLLQRVFPSLEGGVVEQLDEQGYAEAYAAGELIAQEESYATGIYVVKSGLVSIGKHGSREGGKRVLRFLAPGELFGVESVLTGHRLNVQFAKAVVASTLILFERREILAFAGEHPTIFRDFSRWLSREVIMLEFKLTRDVVESTDRNFAMLLLALASNYGKTTDRGIVVDLPVSRQVLAEMVGVSTDTLSRVIKRFRDRSLINGSGKNIVVTDLERLGERARTTQFYMSIIKETM